MVSHLVDEDAGNRTSEEEIVSGSEGPTAVRATLLFGSQRAVSVCLRYPIPVGHCQ